MKIFKGNGECLSFIKQEIASLNNINKNEICIIGLNRNIDLIFSTFKDNALVYSFFSLISKILGNKYEVLSDFMSVKIIKFFSEKVFKTNNALKNLGKSNIFVAELYKLFENFKSCGFNSEILFSTLKNVDIPYEDVSRLNLIFDVYEKYCKFLQENKLYDTLDLFLKSNQKLKEGKFKKYKYIFVIGGENITPLQLEIIKNCVENDNIYLYADLNSQFSSFLGNNIFDKNNSNEINFEIINRDIFDRAQLILGKNNTPDFDKTESILYKTFSNFSDEMKYISDEIREGLEDGENIDDYAIITNNSIINDVIIHSLQEYNLPIKNKLFNLDYKIFITKLSNYINLFEVMQKLGVNAFSPESFCEIQYESKVDYLNLVDEYNTLFCEILSNYFDNKYDIEHIKNLNEDENDDFIYQTLLKNSINFEFDISELNEHLNNLYKAYQNSDYKYIFGFLQNSAEDSICNDLINNCLENLLKFSEIKYNLLHENVLCEEILEIAQREIGKNTSINIMTAFKSMGKRFKKVFIPCLQEGTFPRDFLVFDFISDVANEKVSSELQKVNKHFYKIKETKADKLQSEKNLMYTAMTRADDKLVLTAHETEDAKKILLSPFLESLILFDNKNLIKDEKSNHTVDNEKKLEDLSKYKKIEYPIIDKDRKIYLSASSISTFLKCPQKFYFENLLELKTDTSYSADYGRIVHAVFENVLTKHLKDFDKEIFIELGKILLDSKVTPQKSLDYGFQSKIVDVFKTYSELEIEEMKLNYFNAIDSLDKINYFDKKPLSAECEIFFDFETNEIPNVIFKGFIDAIVEYEDGYRLLDYKTTSDKTVLSKLLTDDSVHFLKSNKKEGPVFSEDKMRKFDYQIPLYYLACLYSEQLKKYKDKIKEIGYVYVRPESKNNGSGIDFITVDNIEIYKNDIIQNIKKYVSDEIFSACEFPSRYDYQNCQYCSFSDICIKIENNNVKEAE